MPADFASMGLHRWLCDSLRAMDIRTPTPIQAACIGPILAGHDCIGGSRTGSGKTVAFAAPILQQWAVDPFGIYALVLTPTRELALQIAEQFSAIGAPQNLKTCLLIGGVDMRTQALALVRRPHIVIATPGRLADHIKSSGEDTICGLRRVKMVVLDEADRILHNTFADDLETCFNVLPKSGLNGRQTLLFTATVTLEVRMLKDMGKIKGKREVFMCEVDVNKLTVPPTLAEKYILVNQATREAFLHVLLSLPSHSQKPTIIFTNRTSTASLLTRILRLLDHRVTALHSQLPQSERTDSLSRFRASAAHILVSTDVASRGLDIPEVELVVNFDVPRDPDDYIHRVGRTARAGKRGEAITLVTAYDIELVHAIETKAGTKMQSWDDIPSVGLSGRIDMEVLQLVSEKKRIAIMDVDEGKSENGKRKRKLQGKANRARRKRENFRALEI